MVIHGLLSLLSSIVGRSFFDCSEIAHMWFPNTFCNLNFVMIRVWMYTKCLFIFRKMFFEKNVNFVIIRVWMYTKYCLLESFEKTTVYENFVCFDLSKQTRRSTLSCKVFILFPLKIYPFTGYKSKVRFCTQNSRI